MVARVLVETDLGFRGTFLAAGAICLVAVALTATVAFLTPDVRAARARDWGGLVPKAGSVPFGEAVRRILRSEATHSLAMILLFACLFTSMTQFQTTFARSQGLDYPVFYVTYTAAVIFSRFVLASMATRFDARLVVASAVSVMVLAVTALLAVGSSALLYGAASAVLGLGYGAGAPERAGAGGQRLRGGGAPAGLADGGPHVPGGDPRLPALRRLGHRGPQLRGPLRGSGLVSAGAGGDRVVAVLGDGARDVSGGSEMKLPDTGSPRAVRTPRPSLLLHPLLPSRGTLL